jgi:WD40 repeat protein
MKVEAGHAETIFDVKFCHSSKNIISSVSFDGTIRLWNAEDMKIMNIIDSRHNSPLPRNSKNIIYCISWHPL